MKAAKYMRTCAACGRTMEPGETCNCEQPVKGLPRDGLRAKCPLFRCRSSYRMRHYIVCGRHKTPYPGSDQRNEHYRRYCCEAWRACELYTTDEGSARK